MTANVNFNKTTNKYSFYSKLDIPWHGLGQVVKEANVSDDVIKLAQLDWDVEKCETYCKYPNQNFKNVDGSVKKGTIVPNNYATVRMDSGEVLGTCTDRYEVVQNRDAFKFIDNIVGEKLAIYETAGSLGKGETIFVSAKLPKFIQPTSNKDDIIEQYLLFTSTHDGSGSVKVMFTPIRVVCNNTLNMALGNNKNKVTFKHTKNIQNKISEIRSLMQLQYDHSLRLQYELAEMALRNINDKQIDETLANVFLTSDQLSVFNTNGNILLSTDFPKKTTNQLITVKSFIEEGVGQNYSRGTAYWLYNGITDYLSNGKSYNNDEDRFLSLMDGLSYNISQKSYNILSNIK